MYQPLASSEVGDLPVRGNEVNERFYRFFEGRLKLLNYHRPFRGSE